MNQIDYSKYEGHTPGPLKVCNGKDVFTVSDPRRRSDSGFQTADCMMDYAMDGEEEMPYDEQRANARLYADAPDLLAACRERDEEMARLREEWEEANAAEYWRGRREGIAERDKEIARLRDKVATYIEDARYYHRQWRHQGELNLDAIQAIARLRGALEWYADPANTRPQRDGFGVTITECECDEGNIARAALADTESQVADTSSQVSTERDEEYTCKTGA